VPPHQIIHSRAKHHAKRLSTKDWKKARKSIPIYHLEFLSIQTISSHVLSTFRIFISSSIQATLPVFIDYTSCDAMALSGWCNGAVQTLILTFEAADPSVGIWRQYKQLVSL